MIRAKLSGDREMLVLKNDEGISEELLLKGHHEPLCTNFIKEIVSPGDNIIEIGANIGYYALIESELVGNKGHIYAIEPVPKNIECLKTNIKEYNISNITPFQLAIGFENTIGKMKLAKFSNSGTLMVDDEDVSQDYKDWFYGWYTEEITVEQMTLDSFRELYDVPIPNLIRMDVEGYELDVIFGGQETLSNMIKGSHIFIELHPLVFKNKLDAMYTILENLYSHGFRARWCEGKKRFPHQLKSFTKYICRPEAHCPHVFFEKGRLT